MWKKKREKRRQEREIVKVITLVYDLLTSCLLDRSSASHQRGNKHNLSLWKKSDATVDLIVHHTFFVVDSCVVVTH